MDSRLRGNDEVIEATSVSFPRRRESILMQAKKFRGLIHIHLHKMESVILEEELTNG